MNIFTKLLIKFIKTYKYIISPLIGPSCRYLPSCSEYSIEALKTYGFAKGLSQVLKELCHAIHGEIVDLIQLKKK